LIISGYCYNRKRE